MHIRPIKMLYVFSASALITFFAYYVLAEEKVIQREVISFEKCIQVITTSENKLSIAPTITDVSDQKRVAVFKLIDGTLTITCDGVDGNITVSTNMN